MDRDGDGGGDRSGIGGVSGVVNVGVGCGEDVGVLSSVVGIEAVLAGVGVVVGAIEVVSWVGVGAEGRCSGNCGGIGGGGGGWCWWG